MGIVCDLCFGAWCFSTQIKGESVLALSVISRLVLRFHFSRA
jgi:hypothetical protein